MFKQFIVSVVFGVSLLSSAALLAKEMGQPAIVAKLDVAHQLSISEHDLSKGQFIQQVREGKRASKETQVKSVPMPLLSGLGFLVFGLMYFVLRSSRQRIK